MSGLQVDLREVKRMVVFDERGEPWRDFEKVFEWGSAGRRFQLWESVDDDAYWFIATDEDAQRAVGWSHHMGQFLEANQPVGVSDG